MKKAVTALIFTLGTSAGVNANIYALNPPQIPENCQLVSTNQQGGTGVRYLQCDEKTKDNEASKTFLIVKSTYQELPNFIKLQFENKREKISDWEQVYLSVATENDDLILFGLCKARDTSCSDDAGYTVGSAISVGATYEGKYDVQMKVANALYTKPLPETFQYDRSNNSRVGDQYIRSALLLEFLVNSARQNNLFYWTLGTGLIGLSSEEKFGIFDAARHQRTVHHFLNSLGRDLAVGSTNLNDGQSDKWGFYLLAGLGVQKFLKSNDYPFSSRSYAQITTRMSTLSKHSELRLELGGDVGYGVGQKGRASVGGNVATTFHADGRVNEASVYIKYETGKRWETSLGFTCQRGTLANYASYNIPNTITGKPDCFYRLSAKYYLD